MQWFQHAWLRPYVKDKLLVFGIIQSSDFPITRQLYGVYHGRFVATLLSHFDDMMENIEITPLMIKEIDVSANE